MRFVLLTCLLALPGFSAHALSQSTFVGDTTFNAICNQGSTNQDCELAIGEFRGGIPGTGDYEGSINLPVSSGNGFKQGETTWVDKVSKTFSFAHDGSGKLTLDLDGLMPNPLELMVGEGNADYTYTGLANMDTMYIRVRNNKIGNTPDEDEYVTLTNLALNGMSIDPITFDRMTDGVGSAGAKYTVLGDFDFSAAWALTGDVTLFFPGLIPPGRSQLDVNFKLATTAPIPLPAPVLLLGAGLGAFGLLRARRT